MTLSTTPPQHQPELEPPLINISLKYLLEQLCRSWGGFAAVPRYFAEEIRRIDPLEEHHHIEDYGHETIVKLYPIQVWRESPEKRTRDKELSAEGRAERFELEAKAKVFVAQIQRKRDIISEVRADMAKKYRDKGKDMLQELGRGLQTWQQQVEAVDYIIYRVLMGKNEKVRSMLDVSQELCNEFQQLPIDKDWRNKRFQEERELEEMLGKEMMEKL
jgi:hypothetical protein